MGLVAWLMFTGGSTYEVVLTLDNAGQLVKGNQVKVGGVPVGHVESIELAEDSRAEIRISVDDDELTPLREGTVATVRATSLAGIANRYVSLALGPNDGDEIADGGQLPAEDAREAVDLDQLLNALGPATQRDLRVLVSRGADALDGSEEELNRAILSLNPALSQGARTSRELTSDEADLERFILASSDVVSQVAARPRELESMVGNANATLSALADRTGAIESTLERLPALLRRTNTTLVNLRALIGDSRPAVREARPAAAPLAETLRRLRPLARDARPLVPRLRRLIDRAGRDDDLLGVLRGLISLESKAVPAFKSTVQTVKDALPVVADARPYTPDLIGGLMNGFGGATGHYFDANGHYARISFQGTIYSLTNAPSLVPLPPSQQGLAGYRRGVVKRCPGGATQRLPDGSNPFLDRPGFPCRPEDTMR